MSVIKDKNDVFTVLIHLGYLAYDWDTDECYIPNKEYHGKVSQYDGRVILVGINYDSKSKKHECRITRVQLEPSVFTSK